MTDSIEAIRERVPFLVTILPYTARADHSQDQFWYSRVTAADLEYYSLKFDPNFWRGAFVVGMNRNSSLLEFLSVNVIKEVSVSTGDLILALCSDKYKQSDTRGGKLSYDVFLSPKYTVDSNE
jgi:hypothetical protein